MITWPAILPQLPGQNFSATPLNGLNDEKEIRNPDRNRTYPERDASFVFYVTTEQIVELMSFYNTTLNGGCAPFDAPWLGLIGYDYHFLRYIAPPSIQNRGAMWAATNHVEIIAGVPVDESGTPTVGEIWR